VGRLGAMGGSADAVGCVPAKRKAGAPPSCLSGLHLCDKARRGEQRRLSATLHLTGAARAIR